MPTASVDVDYKGIARRLRSLRHAHELSQEQFGQICGVSQAAAGARERGEKRYPLSIVSALLLRKRFGVTLDWLYCGAEPKFKKRKKRP
jgi:transcriptional regulator with XRE-family HTH domain